MSPTPSTQNHPQQDRPSDQATTGNFSGQPIADPAAHAYTAASFGSNAFQPAKSVKPTTAKRLLLWLRSIMLAVVLVGVCVALFVFRERVYARFSQMDADGLPAPITAVAREMVIPHEVLAGGELQSADAVDVVCEVESQGLKIVEMLPEGSQVQADQVVVQLDPSQINDQLAQQQIKVTQANAVAKAAAEELKIQRNLAASAIAQAQLTLTLAELDRKKYIKGEYQVELNDLKGSIALAETDLQDAKDLAEHFEKLVRNGFRTPEQLESKQQDVERAKHVLSRDEEKLQVLEQFTKERQAVELTAKAEEAVRELERVRGSSNAAIAKSETDLEVAEATAALEREQLRRIQEQLEHCDVRAPADGTLIYAKDKNKKIELGAPVHFKQRLFSLPDLTTMVVQAFVHESEVQQLSIGMEVDITVDAFPNLPLSGKVVDITTYYDSTRHWMSGGVKEYATEILIQDLPQDVSLRPGMSSKVKIRIGELSRGVIVPVVAVAQRDDASYCFRELGANFEMTKIELGANTEDYVEILSGLRPGDRVALDARARLAAKLESSQRAVSPGSSLTP